MSSLMSEVELDFRILISRLYWGLPQRDDLGMDPRDPYREPRALKIAATHGNYGNLSGVLIQVNGSPPKGTVAVLMESDGTVAQITFLARGRSRTLPKDSIQFRTVERFIDELLRKRALK